MNALEKCKADHGAAMAECSKIHGAARALEATIAELKGQLDEARKAEAAQRADGLLNGGASPKGKGGESTKIALEVEAHSATLAALCERHAEACGVELAARLALRRAEERATAAEVAEATEKIRKIESELERARGRLADRKIESERLSGEIEATRTATVEEIAWRRGSPAELAMLGTDPTTAINREQLKAQLAEWEMIKATRADASLGPVLVRASEAAIFWSRQSGRILDAVLLRVEAADGTAFVGHVDGIMAPYAFKPAERVRQLGQFEAGRRGEPIRLESEPEPEPATALAE